MNEIVIRIYDTSNNILGDLDLKSFNDFPLVLTKGIVNLDNLKARTGTFSKTFKVPNTKNNSNLLVDVDNINARKDYKDALGRKPCAILVNNAQVDKGFIQVLNVKDGFELDNFELVFFGNNIDWVKDAAELMMNQISFSNDSQTYDESSINTANNADSDTYDHAYPYISRGGNEFPGNVQVEDFLPVLYYRSVIEKGLNTLGWNVNSSFLEDENIKRLVCDFSLKFLLSDDEVEATKIYVNNDNVTDYTLSVNDVYRIIFNDESTSPYYDNGSNYDNTTGIYTVPNTGVYNLTVTTDRIARADASNGEARFLLVKDGDNQTSIGSGVVLDSQQLVFPILPNGSPLGDATTGGSFAFSNVSLNAGDNISIYIENNSTGSFDIIYNRATIADPNPSTELKTSRNYRFQKGDVFSLAGLMPSDISLLDAINDFTRMFNIYYWSDVKNNTIYMDKVDIGTGYEIDYVNSYKRNIKFGYKALDRDEWLKEWQRINKRTYADYKHILPERFGEGTDEVRLGIFSAGYAVNAKEAAPRDGGGNIDDRVVPVTMRIWDRYINKTIPLERISQYNPKVYLFNNGTQSSSDGTLREIRKFGASSITIPYGIFETYNNTTSDINLSFTGTDGLFATYYSRMFKNIEEGGRLIANINLDSVDVENLDFRKLVYIAYPEQIAGYYIVEKVIDFNPIKEGLTKVSLFKFENLGSVSIDTGQEGNNDSDIDDGNDTPVPEPIYIEDTNGFLIEVAVEIPVSPGLELVYLK